MRRRRSFSWLDKDLDEHTADSDEHTAVANAGSSTQLAAIECDDHIVSLNTAEAEEVHQLECIVSALEGSIENLRAVGQVRAVSCMEAELTKVR